MGRANMQGVGRGEKGPKAGYEVLIDADGPVYFVATM